MSRRKARELAFQKVFQAEQGESSASELWGEMRLELKEIDSESLEEAYGEALDKESFAFAEELIHNYDQHRERLNERLAEHIQGWDFKQMAQTDLAVLRLGLAELSFSSTPKEVVIEMTVRIAKRYGGEDSGRFVNGVMAKIEPLSPR